MKRYIAQLLAVLVILCIGVPQGYAVPITYTVPFAGGGAKNYFGPNIIPFSAEQIGLMTDSNISTGFTHTSFFGDDIPTQTGGVIKSFEFDISRFASIDEIEFTWTGTHEWNSEFLNSFPYVRINSAESGSIISTLDFGDGISTPAIKTATVVITPSTIAGGSNALERMVRGNIATIVVDSGVGVTGRAQFINIGTLEVGMSVTGTPVPEPGTLVLLSTGTVVGLAFRRRIKNKLVP